MSNTPMRVQILAGLALAVGAGCAGESAPPPATTPTPAPTQGAPTAAAAPAGTPPPITTSAAGDLVSPPSIPRLAGPSKFTPSGLGYIEGVVGTGAVATAGQTVSVHYTGWLTDGSKFDSSRDRGQPFSFPLGRGQVIKGWDEGVAGMKVGGQRRLFIPASLGYGAQGAPPLIPGGASLVFDVELLGVR